MPDCELSGIVISASTLVVTIVSVLTQLIGMLNTCLETDWYVELSTI